MFSFFFFLLDGTPSLLHRRWVTFVAWCPWFSRARGVQVILLGCQGFGWTDDVQLRSVPPRNAQMVVRDYIWVEHWRGNHSWVFTYE